MLDWISFQVEKHQVDASTIDFSRCAMDGAALCSCTPEELRRAFGALGDQLYAQLWDPRECAAPPAGGWGVPESGPAGLWEGAPGKEDGEGGPRVRGPGDCGKDREPGVPRKEEGWERGQPPLTCLPLSPQLPGRAQLDH